MCLARRPGRRVVGQFDCDRFPRWQMGGSGRIFNAMAIPCPKCTVSAAIGIEGEFVFFGGQCIELLGTRYVNRFEWCPILSEAIAQEVRKPLHNLTLD